MAPPIKTGTTASLWHLGQALPGHEPSDQGCWYEATHALSPGQTRAVWVMTPGLQAATQILRFGELTTELGDFSHPLIVMPVDSGFTTDGQPFLVMKQPGHAQSLSAAGRQMPLPQRLGLLLLICEALQELHQKGYGFSAIEADMVGLDAYGQVQLMGLNLCSLAEDPASLLAQEASALSRLLCRLISADGQQQARQLGSEASLPAAAQNFQSALTALLLKASSQADTAPFASSEELAHDLRACLKQLAVAPNDASPPGPLTQADSPRWSMRKTAITLAQASLAALLVFGPYVQANDPLAGLLALGSSSAEAQEAAGPSAAAASQTSAALPLRFMDLGESSPTRRP